MINIYINNELFFSKIYEKRIQKNFLGEPYTRDGAQTVTSAYFVMVTSYSVRKNSGNLEKANLLTNFRDIFETFRCVIYLWSLWPSLYKSLLSEENTTGVTTQFLPLF